MKIYTASNSTERTGQEFIASLSAALVVVLTSMKICHQEKLMLTKSVSETVAKSGPSSGWGDHSNPID